MTPIALTLAALLAVDLSPAPRASPVSVETPVQGAAAPPGEPPPSPSKPPEKDERAPAEPPTTAKEPIPRGAVLEEVAGVVRRVDRAKHELTIETASGVVELSLDRNTMVYTPTGLGTVLDVTVGSHVRAGRNADSLAYWVQLRRPNDHAAPPTQGTGPDGGAGAPAAGAAGAARDDAAAPATPTPGTAPAVPPGG